MVATILSIDTIVSDPQVRGGRPSVVGRAVTVSDLVARHLRWGTSPEELAANFKLTLGQVHAALAYYYMHKAEIDEEMRRDQENADRLKVELERTLFCVRRGETMPLFDDFFSDQYRHSEKIDDLYTRFKTISNAVPKDDVTSIEQAKTDLLTLQSQEQHLIQLIREADDEIQTMRAAFEAVQIEIESDGGLRILQKQALKTSAETVLNRTLHLYQSYKTMVDDWLNQVTNWRRQITQVIRDQDR